MAPSVEDDIPDFDGPDFPPREPDGIPNPETLEEDLAKIRQEAGDLLDSVDPRDEPDGVDTIRAMFEDESPSTEKYGHDAEDFVTDQRVREVARHGDYWVQGQATPGWYASWHPDEVYYRTSTGVWMTSFFKPSEGSPNKPLHKLGPIYEKSDQSNLVDHARREMELLGEEHMTIDAFLRVVQAFADMGHSGASASFFTPMLNDLLQFHNLSPLTDNPDEWNEVGQFSGEGDTWQSTRRPDAFSNDGGKTYYCLDEAREGAGKMWHHSKPHTKEED